MGIFNWITETKVAVGKVQIWLATWFGVGYLPVAPGTWGALAAMPCWWLLQHLRPGFYLLAVLLLLGVAIGVSGSGARHFQQVDPGAIVIDEVVGQLVALTGCPVRLGPVLTGFLLFRAFDILKLFPARWLETNLAGGWGIVLDDVVAGLYAWLILNLLLRMGWV